jgi:hypothetical protein
MIEKMADVLTDFPGSPNRTRCFNHIINLVAKTVIKSFDTPKKEGADRGKDIENEGIGNEDGDWEEAYMEALEQEVLC